MRGRRLLASILVVALGGVSLGVATAWYSDSATIEYQIGAASDFGDHPDEKVWVCKLVGHPWNPKVKKGKNPIHVSVNSTDAENGFSDAHPSYVVENGDVECVVPTTEDTGTNEDPERIGDSGDEPSATTTTTTTTTSTTTSTTTTTSSTSTTSSTTTTSTTLPTTSTTAATEG